MKINAIELKIGDKIMPPAREVRLWMRRRLAEHNLPETALHLTVVSIDEAMPDKGGHWLRITANHAPAWNVGFVMPPRPMVFKVRPESQWAIVERGS